jgi:hypothetical protein
VNAMPPEEVNLLLCIGAIICVGWGEFVCVLARLEGVLVCVHVCVQGWRVTDYMYSVAC